MFFLMLGRGLNYCNEIWCENFILNFKKRYNRILDVLVMELYIKFNFF